MYIYIHAFFVRRLSQPPPEYTILTPQKNSTTTASSSLLSSSPGLEPEPKPEPQPQTSHPQQRQHQQHQTPRVEVRLRPVGWPAADSRGDGTANGVVANVALDMFLGKGGDRRPGYGNGEKLEGHVDYPDDDYRFLADFDSDAVRLWQVRYWGDDRFSIVYGT